jgi:hypothetical protein
MNSTVASAAGSAYQQAKATLPVVHRNDSERNAASDSRPAKMISIARSGTILTRLVREQN